MAQGTDSFIYVFTERMINIYNWDLGLVEKIELGLSYVVTNIVEMVNRLLLTDAGGNLH